MIVGGPTSSARFVVGRKIVIALAFWLAASDLSLRTRLGADGRRPWQSGPLFSVGVKRRPLPVSLLLRVALGPDTAPRPRRASHDGNIQRHA